MNLSTWLEKPNRLRWSLIGLWLLGVVGLLDYVTGHELAFSLFYMLPIALLAWFTNGVLGVVMALASAGVWLIADIFDGATYSSPFIYVWNTLIRLGFFLLAVLLLRLGKALEREKTLARTDYVTGTVNTRFFHALAQREIDRSARYGYPLTMAYIDVDNFKTINDTLGHLAGDKVLQTVAEGMQQHLRKTDVVARVGGDEFAILLPEVGPEAAQAVISKMRQNVLEDMQSNHWPVTFSIGVVTFTVPPHSAEEMLNKADQLMYAVKSSGKNNIRYLTQAD